MLNARDMLVDFELINPTEIHFRPGQFINLNVAENTFRSYSICSSPLLSNQITIVVSVDHDGVGTKYLKNIKINDDVSFIGPSGRFFLPDNLANSLVFIATGTGIGPFISMWYKLEELKYQGNIMFYFGVRTEDEIFFVDKMDYFKEPLNFNYKLCVSRPSSEWKQTKGKVTELFDVSDFSNKQYFLCGHPLMIEDMLVILQKNGVPEENIFHERFTVFLKK